MFVKVQVLTMIPTQFSCFSNLKINAECCASDTKIKMNKFSRLIRIIYKTLKIDYNVKYNEMSILYSLKA